MSVGNDGNEANHLIETTIAEQIRQALRESPGSTARELGAVIESCNSEQLNRSLYDMKSSGHLSAEKDPQSGKLRYSVTDKPIRAGHGTHRAQVRRSVPRQSLDLPSSLNRAAQAILTVLQQRIEDPLDLSLIEAFGDVREALGREGVERG